MLAVVGLSLAACQLPIPSPAQSGVTRFRAQSVMNTFYASLSGSGSACSSGSPCSLTGARDRVRGSNASMSGDIIVSVSDGTFNLEDYRLLYALTRDEHILERYRDLLQYSTQQFSRFDGDLGMPKGASVESFWATESVFGKGFVKVFDGIGHMAWVSGYASLGIVLHLVHEQSKQRNQHP